MPALWKCPNFSLIVWKKEAGRVIMSRLRCKQWSCDYCAQKNREMWRSHLKKRIGRIGGEWWFITITAAEWYREAAKSLENLRRGLDLLFKRIRRVFGKVEYVRVFEVHKNGAYHAHLVMCGLASYVEKRRAQNGCMAFTPTNKKGRYIWSLQTYLKKTCRSLKMGYMVDVSRVNGTAQCVNYICKYITKDTQAFMCRNLRRIQTSSKIGACASRDTAKGWIVAQHVWASDAAGMPVYDANLKITINPSFWRENIVYPPE